MEVRSERKAEVKESRAKESQGGRGEREVSLRSGCKRVKEEKEASVWCACGCEQRRQQVRHGSVTNNTRV